jgi:hypothetical protein
MDASFRIKPECWGTSFASGSESVMWGTLGENGKVDGDNLSKGYVIKHTKLFMVINTYIGN